ncbi:uncharacterized protein OCT59_002082 [Rhizophagus irregularis]|uniref:uncharacterized protein n=1 Tax=Rhizophagus irregularis TaxID=588596 RepID=UPI003320371F|nr:hypothetical protein OCT59_002082 [Rhizophagus irregularis]
MVFLFNRLWHGYRYSRKSVPAWILIFQGISSGMDTVSLGNWFRRGYHFPRKSVPAWILFPRNSATSIFQGYRFRREYRIPKVRKKLRFVSAFSSWALDIQVLV